MHLLGIAELPNEMWSGKTEYGIFSGSVSINWNYVWCRFTPVSNKNIRAAERRPFPVFQHFWNIPARFPHLFLLARRSRLHGNISPRVTLCDVTLQSQNRAAAWGTFWHLAAAVGSPTVVHGDDVQAVEQLALVLVDPLHVHVEHGGRVNLHPVLLLQLLGEL